MRRFLLALPLLLALPSVAQPIELELVGEVEFGVDPRFNTGGSDVWGYTAPDSAEYAIMGTLNGTAIVAVPSLDIVAVIPGPKGEDQYYHRDMKTHGQYLYVVSENTGTNAGLQIIDLSGLPKRADLVNVYAPEGNVRSHNLSVDDATGLLYVLSQDYTGVRIIDASDPLDPQDVGRIPVPDVHDVYAHDGTAWIAEGRSPTFSAWDTTDPATPHLVTRMQVPNAGYVHNIWPSEDGRIVLTTEETVGKTVKVWDVSDADDVELVGEYLGPSGLAHNVQIKGRYAFISHYTAGVTVVDLQDPAAPVEVTRYDTYPASDSSGFAGTWGAFPYTQAGYLYASDLEGKLTVLRVKNKDTSALPPRDAPWEGRARR